MLTAFMKRQPQHSVISLYKLCNDKASSAKKHIAFACCIIPVWETAGPNRMLSIFKIVTLMRTHTVTTSAHPNIYVYDVQCLKRRSVQLLRNSPSIYGKKLHFLSRSSCWLKARTYVSVHLHCWTRDVIIELGQKYDEDFENPKLQN